MSSSIKYEASVNLNHNYSNVRCDYSI